MKRFLSALCLAFGMTGCFLPIHHPDPTITFHSDRSFTPSERECVEDAADQWNKQTQGLVSIGFRYDYNPRNIPDIVTHNSDDRLVRWTSDMQQVKEVEDRRGDGAMLLGQASRTEAISERTQPLEVRLVMDRLQDPHDCRLAAIHEFGHGFGLDHIPNHRGNIMYPSILPRRTACLKMEDLLVFCMVNNCGTVQMKPCAEQPELDPVQSALLDSSEWTDDQSGTWLLPGDR